MEDNILYHYTSLEVLKCIFENYSTDNPYLTFWATNCAYMNDPREISEGIDIIKDALYDIHCPVLRERARVIWENEKIAEALLISSTMSTMGVPYALSFSKNKDNINMWRMYGDNGRGIALGFKRDMIISENCKLEKCEYNDYGKNYEALIDTIRGVFECYIGKIGAAPKGISQKDYDFISICNVIGLVAPLIKNEIYSYENEIRLIKNNKNPKFRVVNGILIPYTTIQLQIESLYSVTIGPDCDRRNINSLRLFFLSKGLRSLSDNIIQSEVPYRN